MPLRIRGDPASQSAPVRLAELWRAESALIRVRLRAHVHGGRIKMAHDMHIGRWHGRREAAPQRVAACSAGVHIVGQKCCDDGTARLATRRAKREVLAPSKSHGS